MNFSLDRFKSLVQLHFAIEGRKVLFSYAIIALLAIGLYTLTTISRYYEGEEPYPGQVITLGMLFVVVLVVSLKTISEGFRRYHNPGSAAANILLPATNAEKFTFQALWYCLVFPISLCLIVIINHLGWWLATGNGVDLLYGAELAEFDIVNNSIQTIAAVSLFFSGAIFFRRRQAGNTILVIVAGSVILSALGALAFYCGITIPDLESIQWISITLYVILTVFCWGLAWYRFKRLQS